MGGGSKGGIRPIVFFFFAFSPTVDVRSVALVCFMVSRVITSCSDPFKGRGVHFFFLLPSFSRCARLADLLLHVRRE